MERFARGRAECGGFTAEFRVDSSSDWDGGGLRRWWRALRDRLVAPFPHGAPEPSSPRWPRWVRLPSLVGSSAAIWLALVLAILLLAMAFFA